MKKMSVPAIFSGLLLLLIGFSCGNNDKTDSTQTQTTSASENLSQPGAPASGEELIAMGEHLVITSGCEDCHSPKKYNQQGMPEPDNEKHLSGHPANLKLAPYDQATIKNGWAMTNQHFTAWVGPWGVSFASNITSDSATGIGSWTEEQFFRTIREGRKGGAPNGRMLLPPMPWPNFAKFTDQELRAIYTYLRSTPAIRNQVPAPMPPKGA